MLLSIILIFIGLVLVGIEFFFPGIFFGILGGLSIVAGNTIFALQGYHLLVSLAFSGGSILGLVAVCKCALWQIKRRRQFFLKDDQEGFVATSYSKEFIGQSGVVDSDLKPSGHVVIKGQRMQAVSDRGYIEKGVKITVLAGQGGRLIVKEEIQK